MPPRKPYNPNTAYGRRKLREEAAENYANDTPEGQKERDNMGCIILIIVIVIAFVVFAATGNLQGFFKWMSK